ncbi:flagellar protein FliT [Paraburkholderia sp. A3BS-1L]|uniref:flagellar protein FliT n=1 Tax=Paraburkholderia sp. A3BS-1L TaxID=3028375 RepID=UPI003DA83A05
MQALADIECILQLTKAIEQAVAVGEWERASQLAIERSPLIMSLSAQQPPATLSALGQIHAIDAQITEAARNATTELNSEYQAAMQATCQARTYQQVSLL